MGDTRVVELGLCDDSSPPCSEANVNPSERPSDGRVHAAERLPRGGALFMSVGEEPITLSALKDHLGTVGWAGGEVKFHTPRQNSTRPWSARVLTADGKTILGEVGRKITKGAAKMATVHCQRRHCVLRECQESPSSWLVLPCTSNARSFDAGALVSGGCSTTCSPHICNSKCVEICKSQIGKK